MYIPHWGIGVTTEILNSFASSDQYYPYSFIFHPAQINSNILKTIRFSWGLSFDFPESVLEKYLCGLVNVKYLPNTAKELAKDLHMHILSKEKNIMLIPINLGLIYPKEDLIKNGIIPNSDHAFKDFMMKKIDFNEDFWVYANLDFYRNLAVKTCDSTHLLLLYPSEVYTISKRPKNDMTMYKMPGYLKKEDVSDYRMLIPVTRYSAEIKGSLFYGPYCDSYNFCGTFYYHEPESTTYLSVSPARYLEGDTKSTVYVELLLMKSSDENFKNAYKYMTGSIDIPQEFYTDFNLRSRYNRIIKKFIPKVKAGTLTEQERKTFDAYEDAFDQKICKVAKSIGIDVLKFKYMAGSHQIVEEILDTRDRDKSFSSLVYEK